jgi:hypothetical protein
MAGRPTNNVTVRQKIFSGEAFQALASDPNKRKIVEARVDVKAIADLVSDPTLTREDMNLKLREMLSVDFHLYIPKLLILFCRIIFHLIRLRPLMNIDSDFLRKGSLELARLSSKHLWETTQRLCF